MSKNIVVIKSISTKAINNDKDLVWDEDGYTTMRVGALGVTAADGAHYVADEEVKSLFSPKSVLAINAKNGSLFGEITHPKPQPGQTANAYKARILNVDYNKACVTFKEVWIEREGNKYIIYAKLKPYGPMKQVLEDGLKDKNINIAFSIRCIVNEAWLNGRLYKTITNPVTFDLVVRPGVAGSDKFNTISLEEQTLATINLDDADEVTDIINSIKHSGIGLENDSTALISYFNKAKSNVCNIKNKNHVMDEW